MRFASTEPSWQAPASPYGTGYPPKKRSKLPWVLGGVGAVLILCVGGTVIAAVSSGNAEDSFADGYAQGAAAQASAQQTTAATATTSAVPAQPAELPTTAPATTKPVSTTAAATTKPVPTTAAAPAKVKVPSGVGLDYQSAQDLWRAAGLVVAPAKDATGAHRLPVIDSNWVVLGQDLKPGSTVESGSLITATVKKYSDD
ncbi:PASTA domain-containing protein [Actinoplanes sp. CA-054009]